MSDAMQDDDPFDRIARDATRIAIMAAMSADNPVEWRQRKQQILDRANAARKNGGPVDEVLANALEAALESVEDRARSICVTVEA